MPRPCNHPDEDLPQSGGLYVEGECKICWQWVNSPPHRAAFEKMTIPKEGSQSNGGVKSQCRHLNPETVYDRKGRLCLGCWVVGCDKFGKCTRVVPDPDQSIPTCQNCRYHQLDDGTPDIEESTTMKTECNDATSSMSTLEMLSLIRVAPPGPWPKEQHWIESEGKWKDNPEKTWYCWKNTQEAMRILSAEFIAGPLGKKPDMKWAGRGIVIAGGMKPVPHRSLEHGYFPCIWLLVNKIRMMGCKLPIQVWYMGDDEMDPPSKKLLRKFGVECVDARKLEAKYPSRILCGWELKPYAALYCPFEEVLFLDADNCPVNQSPEKLFDQPEYRQTGSCFWADYGHWDLETGVWDVFGIEPRAEPAFESGQFMVNKKMCWRELRLSLWYAEYSDFVFGHVYGDKEVFHLAWRKLGTPYTMPEKRPLWEGDCCIVQHDTSGRRVLLHRCQDKWKLNGGNNRVNTLEDENMHHEIVANLRLKEKWDGKPWSNRNPNPREEAVMRSLVGREFRYIRWAKPGFAGDERPMTFDLLPDGLVVSNGSAKCETTATVTETFPDDRPPEMVLAILSQDGRATATLVREDGVWKGCWLEYEKCDVSLVPLGDTKAETKAEPARVKSQTPEEDAEEMASWLKLIGYPIEEVHTTMLKFILRGLRDGQGRIAEGRRASPVGGSDADRDGVVATRPPGLAGEARPDEAAREVPVLR